MDLDDIRQRYAQLRRQLDAAYACLPWDSGRIDDITRRMLPLERVLARHAGRVGPGPQAMSPLPDFARENPGLS